MTHYDSKLLDVLQLLGANWLIKDYQLAGMGWAAVISSGVYLFTFHSGVVGLIFIWVNIKINKYWVVKVPQKKL